MSPTLLLPDCSEFQAPASGNAPNWTAIKARNGGAACIRVGYGNAHLDKMLVSNRAKIKALGYSFCGLYLYLRASQDVPSQARAFINWIGPHLNPGEIPILDLEEGDGNQAARANQWFGIIDAEYGLAKLPLPQRSWLYSGEAFAEEHGLAPIFASARRTWVAAYRSTEPTLGHTLWQSTNGQAGAHITNWPGAGKCDTSLYHGTLDKLAGLAWQPQPAPQPEPATEGWTAQMITDLPALRPGADDKHLPHWYVRRVQSWLNDIYGATPRLVLDGDYGPASQAAIRELIQKRYGLAEDSVIGPATWTALVTGEKP